MLWPPTLRLLVLKVAAPLVRLAVPNEGAPSLKVTVPAAVLGDTVAVKVTDWLKVDGLTDEIKLVVVATGLTVWFRVGLLLPLKPHSRCRPQRYYGYRTHRRSPGRWLARPSELAPCSR